MFDKKQTRRDFIKSSSLTALSAMALSKGINFDNINYLDDYDQVICKKKFKLFVESELARKNIGDAIVEIGKSFEETEYVAGTLDKDITERLVVNLQGLDCVTFVENCLTFARCLKKGKTTFDDYKNELETIRYRDGVLDGYGSRLHYFCDWIYNNETKGIVKNISQEIGGVAYNKKIDFMSSHVKSYKQLSDKSNIEMIQIAEEAINSRDYYYIPTKKISSVYDKLQSGDIIATTTTISGLDVTHTGYIYKDETGTYFLHASLKYKKVLVSSNELQQYIEEDSKKTGIMVTRPQEV